MNECMNEWMNVLLDRRGKIRRNNNNHAIRTLRFASRSTSAIDFYLR